MTATIFSFIAWAACVVIGGCVPLIADKTMRAKCTAYHLWFTTCAQGYAAFVDKEQKIPSFRAKGNEGTWGIWAQHLPQLLADKAISQEEYAALYAGRTTAAQGDAPLLAEGPLASFDEGVSAQLPTSQQRKRTFSLDHKAFLALPFAGGSALLASGIAAAHLPLFSTLVLDTTLIACVLMALIDAKCRIIPTGLALALALGGTLWQLSRGGVFFLEAALCAGAALATLLIIDACSLRLRKEHGIGGGDLRALPGAALLAGFPGILTGCALAGIVFIAFAFAMKITKHLDRATKVPFGPFIALMAIAGLFSSIA